MNKVNILFIITYFNKGGPSKVLINIINNIDTDRFNVYVVTILNKNSDVIINDLKLKNITIVELDYKDYFNALMYGKTKIKKIIKDYSVGVLNSHGILSYIICSKLNIKKFATIHNNMIEDYVNKHGKIIGNIMVNIHINKLNRFDKVIGCSKTVSESLESKLDNVDYIRNGTEKIEIKSDQLRNKYLLRDEDRVFLYVGHISEGKNVVNLVGKFVECHNENEYLFMVGKGDKLSDCQKLADSHIIFTGWQDNPYQYLDMADIYISASKSEGFSTAVLDALNYGLGVFLSDIPSHREIYDIYNNIYIGESFNMYNFHNKFAELRKNYGLIDKQAIIDIKEKRLSAEFMTNEYETMFEKLFYDENK